ncbi:MAG TPA: flippase [Candidatus Andersenbacteria bacterium]|nr:flippase [Candidatus Andersenbacteria bacterium]
MKQTKLTGAIALMVAQAIVLLFGYATHVLIGRLLGPAEYGIYGIVLSIQTIFGMLLTLGVPSAVSKFVAQDAVHAKAILSHALKLQLVISIALSVLLALASPLIAYVLHDPSLVMYVLFVSVIIFFQAFYPVYVQFLSGMHRFNAQAFLTSIYAIAKLVGALALLYFFSLYGALAGFAIGGIIAALLGWYWTRGIPKIEGYSIHLKSFLSFAGTYAIILVGLQVLMSQDLFMVKALLKNDVLAGYYNAAVTLSRISYMLLQGLSFVLLPSVAALTRPGASHDKAVQFIRDTLRYLIILIVPSVALASATSKGLIILFFSNKYIQAAPVLTVLMVGLGCLSFYLLLANIVAGAGKPKAGLYITGLMIIISAAIGSFSIPMFGLIGAAWQTTIASSVGLAALAIYTFHVFAIPYPIKSTINVGIATACMIIPTYIWHATGVLLLGQYIVVGLLYLGVLWIMGEVTEKDTTYALSIIRK